ncbi:MAG: ATP-binding cassette domain-containing protein [Candidatus Pristimantibacillus lignocellulolyticus]|uniref:ATP-binding cassette domain-containing protein n=1 Tax=Candidatus Pristimantibacillus lignocellulolyticus TaxID=2994561 RepID=A0A9J6ZD13_9BACL|nr:MAG: ATP-binding cassette domain-containing protein [Candidatus Pristimantibacillus lignocellulolyticus]
MEYQLNDVSVNYNESMALYNINCTIQSGKWISIIGQTGAGKSTFVQLLKGLIPNISGEYLIDKQPVLRERKGHIKVNSDIGYVFQYPEHQLFETTVYKELAFAPKIKGYSDQQIKKSIDSILSQMDLSEEILQLAPFQLSGGQKRSIAIASVLITDPQLLILDEPTAGLDPVNKAALLQLLKQWQDQHNRTVLFVSHQMNDVAEYSDEVIMLHEGKLVGHFDTNHLFLKQADLLENLGLSLPEPVQLLMLVEELSGQTIEVSSCREQHILEKVSPIWHARS